MRASTLSGALVLFAFACAKPYQPLCRATGLEQISERTGTLRLGPNGQVSLMAIEAVVERDGGARRFAHVEVYAAGGDRLTEWQVELPVPSGPFGLFGASTAVDLESSVAVSTPFELQSIGPDGGTAIVRSTRVELRYRDGGVAAVPTDFDPYAVYRAENSAVFASGVLGGPPSLLAVPELNPTATVQLSLGPSERPIQGGDALAVLPGPRLLTASLEPLGSAPQTARQPGGDFPVFGWSRAAAVLTSAWVDADGNLLHQSFAFDGTTLGPVARLSSASGVLAVARSEHGTGVLFHVAEQLDGGLPRPWFAFADDHGVKKGPDLPLSPGAAGFTTPVVSAGSSGDRFDVFSVLDGVQHVTVQCE